MAHVPLTHNVHGGTALFPEGAVDYWRTRGWEPPKKISSRRPARTSKKSSDDGADDQEMKEDG